MADGKGRDFNFGELGNIAQDWPIKTAEAARALALPKAHDVLTDKFKNAIDALGKLNSKLPIDQEILKALVYRQLDILILSPDEDVKTRAQEALDKISTSYPEETTKIRQEYEYQVSEEDPTIEEDLRNAINRTKIIGYQVQGQISLLHRSSPDIQGKIKKAFIEYIRFALADYRQEDFDVSKVDPVQFITNNEIELISSFLYFYGMDIQTLISDAYLAMPNNLKVSERNKNPKISVLENLKDFLAEPANEKDDQTTIIQKLQKQVINAPDNETLESNFSMLLVASVLQKNIVTLKPTLEETEEHFPEEDLFHEFESIKNGTYQERSIVWNNVMQNKAFRLSKFEPPLLTHTQLNPENKHENDIILEFKNIIFNQLSHSQKALVKKFPNIIINNQLLKYLKDSTVPEQNTLYLYLTHFFGKNGTIDTKKLQELNTEYQQYSVRQKEVNRIQNRKTDNSTSSIQAKTEIKEALTQLNIQGNIARIALNEYIAVIHLSSKEEQNRFKAELLQNFRALLSQDTYDESKYDFNLLNIGTLLELGHIDLVAGIIHFYDMQLGNLVRDIYTVKPDQEKSNNISSVVTNLSMSPFDAFLEQGYVQRLKQTPSETQNIINEIENKLKGFEKPTQLTDNSFYELYFLIKNLPNGIKDVAKYAESLIAQGLITGPQKEKAEKPESQEVISNTLEEKRRQLLKLINTFVPNINDIDINDPKDFALFKSSLFNQLRYREDENTSPTQKERTLKVLASLNKQNPEQYQEIEQEYNQNKEILNTASPESINYQRIQSIQMCHQLEGYIALMSRSDVKTSKETHRHFIDYLSTYLINPQDHSFDISKLNILQLVQDNQPEILACWMRFYDLDINQLIKDIYNTKGLNATIPKEHQNLALPELTYFSNAYGYYINSNNGNSQENIDAELAQTIEVHNIIRNNVLILSNSGKQPNLLDTNLLLLADLFPQGAFDLKKYAKLQQERIEAVGSLRKSKNENESQDQNMNLLFTQIAFQISGYKSVLTEPNTLTNLSFENAKHAPLLQLLANTAFSPLVEHEDMLSESIIRRLENSQMTNYQSATRIIKHLFTDKKTGVLNIKQLNEYYQTYKSVIESTGLDDSSIENVLQNTAAIGAITRVFTDAYLACLNYVHPTKRDGLKKDILENIRRTIYDDKTQTYNLQHFDFVNFIEKNNYSALAALDFFYQNDLQAMIADLYKIPKDDSAIQDYMSNMHIPEIHQFIQDGFLEQIKKNASEDAIYDQLVSIIRNEYRSQIPVEKQYYRRLITIINSLPQGLSSIADIATKLGNAQVSNSSTANSLALAAVGNTENTNSEIKPFTTNVLLDYVKSYLTDPKLKYTEKAKQLKKDNAIKNYLTYNLFSTFPKNIEKISENTTFPADSKAFKSFQLLYSLYGKDYRTINAIFQEFREFKTVPAINSLTKENIASRTHHTKIIVDGQMAILKQMPEDQKNQYKFTFVGEMKTILAGRSKGTMDYASFDFDVFVRANPEAFAALITFYDMDIKRFLADLHDKDHITDRDFLEKEFKDVDIPELYLFQKSYSQKFDQITTEQEKGALIAEIERIAHYELREAPSQGRQHLLLLQLIRVLPNGIDDVYKYSQQVAGNKPQSEQAPSSTPAKLATIEQKAGSQHIPLMIEILTLAQRRGAKELTTIRKEMLFRDVQIDAIRMMEMMMLYGNNEQSFKREQAAYIEKKAKRSSLPPQSTQQIEFISSEYREKLTDLIQFFNDLPLKDQEALKASFLSTVNTKLEDESIKGLDSGSFCRNIETYLFLEAGFRYFYNGSIDNLWHDIDPTILPTNFEDDSIETLINMFTHGDEHDEKKYFDTHEYQNITYVDLIHQLQNNIGAKIRVEDSRNLLKIITLHTQEKSKLGYLKGITETYIKNRPKLVKFTGIGAENTTETITQANPILLAPYLLALAEKKEKTQEIQSIIGEIEILSQVEITTWDDAIDLRTQYAIQIQAISRFINTLDNSEKESLKQEFLNNIHGLFPNKSELYSASFIQHLNSDSILQSVFQSLYQSDIDVLHNDLAGNPRQPILYTDPAISMFLEMFVSPEKRFNIIDFNNLTYERFLDLFYAEDSKQDTNVFFTTLLSSADPQNPDVNGIKRIVMAYMSKRPEYAEMVHVIENERPRRVVEKEALGNTKSANTVEISEDRAPFHLQLAERLISLVQQREKGELLEFRKQYAFLQMYNTQSTAETVEQYFHQLNSNALTLDQFSQEYNEMQQKWMEWEEKYMEVSEALSGIGDQTPPRSIQEDRISLAEQITLWDYNKVTEIVPFILNLSAEEQQNLKQEFLDSLVELVQNNSSEESNTRGINILNTAFFTGSQNDIYPAFFKAFYDFKIDALVQDVSARANISTDQYKDPALETILQMYWDTEKKTFNRKEYANLNSIVLRNALQITAANSEYENLLKIVLITSGADKKIEPLKELVQAYIANRPEYANFTTLKSATDTQGTRKLLGTEVKPKGASGANQKERKKATTTPVLTSVGRELKTEKEQALVSGKVLEHIDPTLEGILNLAKKLDRLPTIEEIGRHIEDKASLTNFLGRIKGPKRDFSFEEGFSAKDISELFAFAESIPGLLTNKEHLLYWIFRQDAEAAVLQFLTNRTNEMFEENGKVYTEACYTFALEELEELIGTTKDQESKNLITEISNNTRALYTYYKYITEKSKREFNRVIYVNGTDKLFPSFEQITAVALFNVGCNFFRGQTGSGKSLALYHALESSIERPSTKRVIFAPAASKLSMMAEYSKLHPGESIGVIESTDDLYDLEKIAEITSKSFIFISFELMAREETYSRMIEIIDEKGIDSCGMDEVDLLANSDSNSTNNVYIAVQHIRENFVKKNPGKTYQEAPILGVTATTGDLENVLNSIMAILDPQYALSAKTATKDYLAFSQACGHNPHIAFQRLYSYRENPKSPIPNFPYTVAAFAWGRESKGVQQHEYREESLSLSPYEAVIYFTLWEYLSVDGASKIHILEKALLNLDFIRSDVIQTLHDDGRFDFLITPVNRKEAKQEIKQAIDEFIHKHSITLQNLSQISTKIDLNELVRLGHHELTRAAFFDKSLPAGLNTIYDELVKEFEDDYSLHALVLKNLWERKTLSSKYQYVRDMIRICLDPAFRKESGIIPIVIITPDHYFGITHALDFMSKLLGRTSKAAERYEDETFAEFVNTDIQIIDPSKFALALDGEAAKSNTRSWYEFDFDEAYQLIHDLEDGNVIHVQGVGRKQQIIFERIGNNGEIIQRKLNNNKHIEYIVKQNPDTNQWDIAKVRRKMTYTEKIIYEWKNNPNAVALIGTRTMERSKDFMIQVVGEGPNKKVGVKQIFLYPPWNASRLEQYLGRMMRQGQKLLVDAIITIAKDTIDEGKMTLVRYSQYIMEILSRGFSVSKEKQDILDSKNTKTQGLVLNTAKTFVRQMIHNLSGRGLEKYQNEYLNTEHGQTFAHYYYEDGNDLHKIQGINAQFVNQLIQNFIEDSNKKSDEVQVLDVCAGTGVFPAISKLKTTLVDVNRHTLRIAEDRLDDNDKLIGHEFITASATKIKNNEKIADNLMDYAIWSFAMHWSTPEERIDILDGIHQKLKLGGKLVITIPKGAFKDNVPNRLLWCAETIKQYLGYSYQSEHIGMHTAIDNSGKHKTLGYCFVFEKSSEINNAQKLKTQDTKYITFDSDSTYWERLPKRGKQKQKKQEEIDFEELSELVREGRPEYKKFELRGLDNAQILLSIADPTSSVNPTNTQVDVQAKISSQQFIAKPVQEDPYSIAIEILGINTKDVHSFTEFRNKFVHYLSTLSNGEELLSSIKNPVTSCIEVLAKAIETNDNIEGNLLKWVFEKVIKSA